PAAPEPATPESKAPGDASTGEAADEAPPVIDLEEPEAAPTAPNEEPAAPMDAEELQSAYDDLVADEAGEGPAESEPEPAPEPEPEPAPEGEPASTPETQPGEVPSAADDAEEPPEGLHPLEADESAAWDELEDDVADLLNDVDEVGTKLDLARAYIDMGDAEGARGILEEVVEEGNEEQQQEARSLLDQGQG
ncbi:MAG: FimV/HubP family polar landmark protein, partial [Pseudomonadota bacterium]